MFIKDTFKFIATNKRLIIVALCPAVLWSFFASPASLIPSLFNYRIITDAETGQLIGPFRNLGAALNVLAPVKNPLWLLLLLPVAFIFCAVMFGFSEHKMRVGNYGFGGFLQRINFGVTALAVPFVLLCSIYFIWMFATACVLVFIEYICLGLIGSRALSFVMVIIFALLLFILFILLASLTLLWPAVTLISGYGPMDSWYYQLKLLSGRMIKFAISAGVVFFINSALITSFGLFLGGLNMVFINIVCFTFTLMYLVGLSMTAYFRLSNTPRKDMKTKYYLR